MHRQPSSLANSTIYNKIVNISTVLKSPGFQAQKHTKTESRILIIRNSDRRGSSLEKGNSRGFMKIYVLRFLWNEDRLSDDFNVVRSSFQIIGAATEKERLPRFSLNVKGCG